MSRCCIWREIYFIDDVLDDLRLGNIDFLIFQSINIDVKVFSNVAILFNVWSCIIHVLDDLIYLFLVGYVKDAVFHISQKYGVTFEVDALIDVGLFEDDGK